MISIIQEAVRDRSKGSKLPKGANAKRTMPESPSQKRFYPTMSLLFVLGLSGLIIAYSVFFSEGLFVKELAIGFAILLLSLLFRQFDGDSSR